MGNMPGLHTLDELGYQRERPQKRKASMCMKLLSVPHHTKGEFIQEAEVSV